MTPILDAAPSPASTREKLARILAGRGAVPAAVAAALLLSLPSLRVGLHSDDLAHALAVSGQAPFPAQDGSPLNLFTFANGDPATNREAIDRGMMPWWTDPHLRLRFFRPLSAATHWLDFRFLGRWPALMHAQNLAWLAAMILAAAALYRRVSGPGAAAALAALLFAADDAHAGAIAWISGRNGLVASTFAICAVVQHDRWRRDGARAAMFFAPLLLAAGLAGGEAAVPIGGYLLAYAVFLDRGTIAARALSLFPYVPVTIAWRLIYATMNYGAYGSATYIDPAGEPLRFIQAVGVRAPIQILATWGLPYAEVFEMLSPGAATAMWSAAAIVTVLLLAALVPHLARSPQARFWALGMLLAIPPNCATIPADRVLILVGLGAHALIAQMLVTAAAELREGRLSRLRRAVNLGGGALLVAIHLVLAPLLLPIRTRAEGHGRAADMWSLPMLQADPALTERHVVMVNGLGAWWGPLFRINLEHSGRQAPRRITMLASGYRPVDVTRVDERTLRVRPRRGYLVPPRTPAADGPQAAAMLDRVYRLQQSDVAFRNDARSFRVGEQVALDGVTAEVAALTEDGRPAEAVFRFDAPLEDAKWVWLYWTGGAHDVFALPAIGTTVTLEGGI